MRLLVNDRIPLWLKCAYTAFLAVLVPYYWLTYGPANFLFFCDVALLLTFVALWAENRLLASMQLVAIGLPQLLWIVEFLLQLVGGPPLTGLASYMFSPSIPLWVRGLSLFHGWLPILPFWMVWPLGYDRRALPAQIVLPTALLVDLLLLHGRAARTAKETPTRPLTSTGSSASASRPGPQTFMPPCAWLAYCSSAFPSASICRRI